MRDVNHDARRHVARSVRGRRGPAALLGLGEFEQSTPSAHEVAATVTEERSSIVATQLEQRECSRANSPKPPPSIHAQGAEGDRAWIWRRSAARSADGWRQHQIPRLAFS